MAEWPKEVTMVTAKDICRDEVTSGEKHCAYGWFYSDFDVIDDPYYYYRFSSQEDRFNNEFLRQARLLGAVGERVPSINDNHENPLSLIARIINRTWAALGYVVGNPECDKNGKLKPVKK